MSKIGSAAFIALLALVVTGAISCGQRGEGKNIANGKSCIVGTDKSTCAAGLYCEPTGKITGSGDTYYQPGLCMQQKAAGQSCSLGNKNECAAPLECLSDSTSASTDYLASLSSPRHCR